MTEPTKLTQKYSKQSITVQWNLQLKSLKKKDHMKPSKDHLWVKVFSSLTYGMKSQPPQDMTGKEWEKK
jgi:hypothetical protein